MPDIDAPVIDVFVRHLFDTEVEARAFALGVEYANDSAITVESILPFSDPEFWMVRVQDDEADEDDTIDHREADDA